MTYYDAIVIGAGQAGGPLATALAKAGRRTALVERAHVGGTCINEGCTPTKTMVASARVAYLARRGAEYGVETGPISVDLEVVRQRKRDIVTSFRSGNQRRLTNTEGLDLIIGDAAFTGSRTIVVRDGVNGGRALSAENVFINCGARPRAPEIPGLRDASALNSTSIMELGRVPEHLVILGGGYIGLEFGQMFRRFGARVTVVQRAAKLLAREDPDVADEVASIMREDGIEVLLEADALRVEPGPCGPRVTVRTAEGERTIDGSHILAATGRVPNTDTLDLSAAGIAADSRGFVRVNDRLETNVSGVYALGDVNGGPAFTHVSYDDFRVIRDNLLGGGRITTTGRLVPYTVFIDPQLGRVGLTETDARARGLDVRVMKMPMSYVARAIEVAETRGFIKVIVDAGTDRILGCAILGIEGGEMMAMIQLAMMGGLTAATLRDTVFAHPTLAEALNNVFPPM